MTDDTQSAAAAGIMRAAFASCARTEWGNYTVLTICATEADDEGNFEVAVISPEYDGPEPVWEPVKCNVDRASEELHAVLNQAVNLYADWQSDRYMAHGKWFYKDWERMLTDDQRDRLAELGECP